MRSTIAAATMLAAAILTAPAFAGNRGGACIARVLHSEQLPYALPEHWLAKVALEITSPDGRAYEIQHTLAGTAAAARPDIHAAVRPSQSG
jgi:hypothetical protein